MRHFEKPIKQCASILKNAQIDMQREFLVRLEYMMKAFFCALLFVCSQVAWAEGERVYQYRADGSREWSANYYERKGDTWIPYRPDGSRDWKSNTVKIEGGKSVQYRPDGSRDWNAPVQQLRSR